MAAEQTTNKLEIQGENWLYKADITRRLHAIADSEPVEIQGKNQLKTWMSQTGIFETFRDAVNSFGHPKKLEAENSTGWPLLFSKEVLFDELEIGEDGQESRLFQARLIKPSAIYGPAIHIYARDGGLPVYGVFLPFTDRGILDVSRPISGSHFLAEGLHSFGPPREPVLGKDGNEMVFSEGKITPSDKEISSVITYATQMAAAQLASHLDKVDPKKPEPDKEESEFIAEQNGQAHIKRSRLAGILGWLAAPWQSSL